MGKVWVGWKKDEEEEDEMEMGGVGGEGGRMRRDSEGVNNVCSMRFILRGW